jgi:glycosyltransferase involved in cell wall biosynthesis
VLFLTRYPYEGASSRYRVFQYIPYLETMDVACTVQSFMNSEMYERYFSKGATGLKVRLMIKAIIRRLSVLSRFKDYDIIYMQRELFPFGPPWFERYMKNRGTVLFFDYDDALFIGKPSRFNPIANFFRSPGKTFELFGIVDCVVAGNDWLRDKASGYSARSVTLEVAEDTDRIKMHAPHSNCQPVTIGWLGSTSTVKYLHLIAPALQKIAAQYPDVRFEIMGGGQFEMDGVPWVISGWSLQNELEGLSRFDIGLMPLPVEEWAQGKSGGKARTYMAAGVVPVCTGVGYNRELIRHSETGFLCNTEQEWYSSLTALIENPDLRQKTATKARADVISRFSLSRQASILRNLFEDVLDKADLQRNTQNLMTE